MLEKDPNRNAYIGKVFLDYIEATRDERFRIKSDMVIIA
jgi:hypothetical protein